MTADEWFAKPRQEAAGLNKLRDVLLRAGLEESIKWGGPAYSHHGRLTLGIGAFKSYFGLWFHQGALLDDPDGVFVNAQEGKTRGMRQWRFTSTRDIKVRQVRRYVQSARAVAASGQSIKPNRGKPLAIPPELDAALKADKVLARAFDGFTLGKRREFAEHIADAKRDATKRSRLQKMVPMIKAGVGLNDKYR